MGTTYGAEGHVVVEGQIRSSRKNMCETVMLAHMDVCGPEMLKSPPIEPMNGFSSTR